MCKKESNKVFHCDDIAQRKSEICGISRKQIFHLKKIMLQSLIEEENPTFLTIISKNSV